VSVRSGEGGARVCVRSGEDGARAWWCVRATRLRQLECWTLGRRGVAETQCTVDVVIKIIKIDLKIKIKIIPIQTGRIGYC